MAATPSVLATSSTFFLLFLSSLLLFVLLFLLSRLLRTKKHSHPSPGCREKGHLDLRRHLPAKVPPTQPPPRVDGDDGGEKEAAGAVVEESVGGEDKGRRKKTRKKKVESRGGSEGSDDAKNAVAATGGAMGEVGSGSMESTYPFSSSASATQRKIKLQYDEIVKSNKAKTLSMTQVSQFVDFLIEARRELERKSETIQRSLKIKRALLNKADRSSFDRIYQQIHKLEADHKRLEDDAAVYNLLQEQLKLSPAYKKMLDVCANTEQKDDSDQAIEIPDISFEELLAQEKKDSFWQKNRKLR
ncbi:hypothetical protein Cni_G17872 [Canna indica]|uniref:Uncharacterized protein n=1 Tax=Canna indica TaxID=4628 RepID=A0AAQ3QFJ7_9LILI|nr:hypothetical protein Cni_G17872 [Canna indica]